MSAPSASAGLRIHQILDAAARTWPDSTAVIHGAQRTSYAELAAHTRATAGWLRSLEVARGDRVALIIPNVPEFITAYYAISALGAISVPLNPLLTRFEIEHALRDSGATLILAWEGMDAEAVTAGATTQVPVKVVTAGGAAALPPPADTSSELGPAGDETAVILYTSGTTGRPKGAELMHRNLVSNSYSVRDLVGYQADDIIFGCLPLFHVFGQVVSMNGAFASGSTLSLLTRFDPAAAIAAIRRDAATLFVGVPTMFSALVTAAESAGDDAGLPSLRLCITGGSPMPPATATRFSELFDCEVREGYGLSETTSVVTLNIPGTENRLGSIGQAIPGVEVAIAQADPETGIGELLIRGPQVMKGYYGQPQATALALRAGWFHTGDLAYLDKDGYVFLVDRLKDLILRGGYNVYPRDVEDALVEHPAIAEASVVGIPHDSLGEEVAAAIVLRDEISTDAVTEWARTRLAAYKYPRVLLVVDTLPKGATGKVLRRETRKLFPT